MPIFPNYRKPIVPLYDTRDPTSRRGRPAMQIPPDVVDRILQLRKCGMGFEEIRVLAAVRKCSAWRERWRAEVAALS